jgi:hypothetical protein
VRPSLPRPSYRPRRTRAAPRPTEQDRAAPEAEPPSVRLLELMERQLGRYSLPTLPSIDARHQWRLEALADVLPTLADPSSPSHPP